MTHQEDRMWRSKAGIREHRRGLRKAKQARRMNFDRNCVDENEAVTLATGTGHELHKS